MPIARAILPMLMKGKRSSFLFLGLGWYLGARFGIPDSVQDSLVAMLGQGGDLLGSMLGGGGNGGDVPSGGS